MEFPPLPPTSFQALPPLVCSPNPKDPPTAHPPPCSQLLRPLAGPFWSLQGKLFFPPEPHLKRIFFHTDTRDLIRTTPRPNPCSFATKTLLFPSIFSFSPSNYRSRLAVSPPPHPTTPPPPPHPPQTLYYPISRYFFVGCPHPVFFFVPRFLFVPCFP